VGRQVGVNVPSAGTLLSPSVSIQLGTRYLRGQLDNWSGNWAQTLAAYNAGPGRVKEWLSYGTYREQAEFVESIPFNETREYVQAVLRNADMYRTIYGERHPSMPDVKELSTDVPPVVLSVLPAAARTPGGGVKTISAITPATHTHAAVKKPAAAANHTPSPSRPGAASHTAAKKAPAPKAAPKAATRKTAPKKARTDPA
jgi:hypothetical protein